MREKRNNTFPSPPSDGLRAASLVAATLAVVLSSTSSAAAFEVTGGAFAPASAGTALSTDTVYSLPVDTVESTPLFRLANQVRLLPRLSGTEVFQDFGVTTPQPVPVPAGPGEAGEEEEEDEESPDLMMLMLLRSGRFSPNPSGLGPSWIPVIAERKRDDRRGGGALWDPPVICWPEEPEEPPLTSIMTEMKPILVLCGAPRISKREGEEGEAEAPEGDPTSGGEETAESSEREAREGMKHLVNFFYSTLPLPSPYTMQIDPPYDLPPLEEPPSTAIMTEVEHLESLVWAEGLTTETVGRLLAGGGGLTAAGASPLPAGRGGGEDAGAEDPSDADDPSDVPVEDWGEDLYEDLPERSTLPEPEGPTGEEAARQLHPVLPGDHRHNRPPPEGATRIPEFPVWAWNRSQDHDLERNGRLIYLGDAEEPGLTVRQGLILLRDTRVEQLDAFARSLRGLLVAPDQAKAALARGLLASAPQVREAYRAMQRAWADMRHKYGIPVAAAVRAGTPTSVVTMATREYESLAAEAQAAAKAGDEATAAEKAAAAAETPFGRHLAARQAFIQQLQRHPLMGVREGAWLLSSGTPLWDALLDLDLSDLTPAETDARLVELLDSHLEMGIQGAVEAADEYRHELEFKNLIKLADPRYAAHHEAARRKGYVKGSSLPGDLVDAALGYHHGVTTTEEREQALYNAIRDLSLATLAVLTTPVPVVGFVVNAGISGYYVLQEGGHVYVAYGEELEARQTAGVTGEQAVLEAEERSSEAVEGLVMASAFGAFDVLTVARLGRLRAAGPAAAGADEAPAIGVRELAPDEVQYWRNKYVMNVGLEDVEYWLAIAEKELDGLDELLRVAQRHGVTPEELRTLLRAHRSAMTIDEMAGVLQPEIVLRSALNQGAKIVVQPSELGEFLRWAPGARSAPVRQVDLLTLYWVRAKAEFEAAGVAMPWTARERAFVQDELLPNWADLPNWAEFNQAEGGFLRLFDRRSLRNIAAKSIEEGLQPNVRWTPRAARGGGEPAVVPPDPAPAAPPPGASRTGPGDTQVLPPPRTEVAPSSALETGRPLPLRTADEYADLVRRQAAGEAVDLGRIARPGIARVGEDGTVYVLQGAGRWNRTPPEEFLDLFVDAGAPLPSGRDVQVIESGVPREVVRQANLLSSRGAAGSNPFVVDRAIGDARTFVRVRIRARAVEAPTSEIQGEIETLVGELRAQGRYPPALEAVLDRLAPADRLARLRAIAGWSETAPAGAAAVPRPPEAPTPTPPTERYGAGQVVNPLEGETFVESGRLGGRGTATWTRRGTSATTPPDGLDDMVLFHARQEAAGRPQSWTPAELQRLHELRDDPTAFRSLYGQRLTPGDVEALERATTAATPTGLFRIELPPAPEVRLGPPATDPPGFPRTGPGDTQVIPFLQDDWVPPRLGPGDTQVPPRYGPGDTQVLPRRIPEPEIIADPAEPLFFRPYLPDGAAGGSQQIPRPSGPARLQLPQDADRFGGPSAPGSSSGSGRGLLPPGGDPTYAHLAGRETARGEPSGSQRSRVHGPSASLDGSALLGASGHPAEPSVANPAEEPLELYLVSTGGSTGEVMEMRVLNAGGPVEVDIPWAVLEHVPLDHAARTEIQERLELVEATRGSVTVELHAYCLDLHERVPEPGMLFRIAPAAAQGRHASLQRVVDAARHLRDEGLLGVQGDPTDYFHSITQWAIWSRREGFGQEGFTDAFVEHVRKAAAEADYEWSEAVAEQVRAAAPARWRDVQRVLEAAAERPETPGAAGAGR